MLRAEFMVAQAALSIADAEALFQALESTSHTLSAGSLNLAYFRFNNSVVDQATKDAFNPLFRGVLLQVPKEPDVMCASCGCRKKKKCNCGKGGYK